MPILTVKLRITSTYNSTIIQFANLFTYFRVKNVKIIFWYYQNVDRVRVIPQDCYIEQDRSQMDKYNTPPVITE